MPMKVYKYRLYPNQEQQNKIIFTLERCRLLYNRFLEERRIAYETDKTSLNYYAQNATLPERKKYIPALKEVHSQVLQDVANRLDRTYKSFFRRIKNGEAIGSPRFKNKNRYRSFLYPQFNKKSGSYLLDNGKIRFSKIGDVRIKLHRQPQGKIKTCAIVVENGKFYASLTCEVEMNTPAQSTGKQVGVDLGVKHLAITSDGTFFDSPKYLRKSEKRLKMLQRSVSRKKRGSNRRKKSISLLARLHEHVKNQRLDNSHKVSRHLANNYDLIAFENLNTVGMLKNHSLAKSISDAGWNQLIRFTTYKAESAGRRVVLVDPRNTSQECSGCGEIVKKTLSVRTHICPHCGLTLDRDINAAINILKRAL